MIKMNIRCRQYLLLKCGYILVLSSLIFIKKKKKEKNYLLQITTIHTWCFCRKMLTILMYLLQLFIIIQHVLRNPVYGSGLIRNPLNVDDVCKESPWLQNMFTKSPFTRYNVVDPVAESVPLYVLTGFCW